MAVTPESSNHSGSVHEVPIVEENSRVEEHLADGEDDMDGVSANESSLNSMESVADHEVRNDGGTDNRKVSTTEDIFEKERQSADQKDLEIGRSERIHISFPNQPRTSSARVSGVTEADILRFPNQPRTSSAKVSCVTEADILRFLNQPRTSSARVSCVTEADILRFMNQPRTSSARVSCFAEAEIQNLSFRNQPRTSSAKVSCVTEADILTPTMYCEFETVVQDAGKVKVEKEISMLGMFKYRDWRDVIYMVVGFFGAIGDGLAMPASLALTSSVINAFGRTANLASLDPEKVENKISKFVLLFVYTSLVCGTASFLEAFCWMRTGERQASRLRSMYLKAILRQNEGFFDTAGANTAEVVNSVSVDTMAVQEAISEKVGNFIANLSTFIGGFAVSLYMEWRVAVILLGFSPLLIIPGLMYGRILTSLARRMQSASARAGMVAQEAISSIRTVYSFVGENKALDRYSRALNTNVKLGLKMGLAKGLAVGSYGIIFAIWGFMSWYGSKLVTEKGINGGKLICAGLASLSGGLALGNAIPNLKYFAEGRSAASRIYAILERVPEIDIDNLTGRVLPSVEGTIDLRAVDFAYPSRPDTQIFRNFNLHIPAGTTVALVGSSGSGKSTVVALIERFYDPQSGLVLLDGVDIKELQLKWLRMQIGLVSQEPALFATTVRENILYGKENASQEEIMQAAKAANAHGFISMLPQGYDTQVGEKGLQMSGGQKQRIAIARAILKNPPILLLDEATSALDAESESVVQQALESASIGRTTVIVAHRLSTIRRADSIAVVSGGQIVEMGSHEKLRTLEGGSYATLVQLQQIEATKRKNSLLDRDSLRRSSLSGSGSSMGRSKASIILSRLSKKFVEVVGGKPDVPALENEPPAISKGEPPIKAPSLARIIALNRPEWKQAVFGCTGAIAYGFVQPLYAYFLGSLVSVLYIVDHHRLRDRANRFALTFLGISIACFMVNFVQHYNFAAMGELLTKRIKTTMLSKVFTFEMGWFDRDENTSGAVCSRLASEAPVARSLIGDRISLLVQVTSAIFFSFLLGLLTSWRLALVMIAVQPIVILCYYARTVLLHRMYNLTMEAQEACSQVAGEAVVNHRTISAFSSQRKIMDLFDGLTDNSQKEAQSRAVIAGLGLGAAQAAIYLTWALDFWWGGQLVKRGQLNFSDLFKCFFILVSSGRMVADAGSMTTDLAKGSGSIIKVFSILDRVTEINPDDSSGIKLDKIDGHVHLRGVDFAYPSRPEVMIFKNFSLRVRAGNSVALVGQSGSGKSTIIGLIERYYDPLEGRVEIDGRDLKTLHLRTFRKQIALVGQEPTLFAGTIRENILYGRENATETEMVEACKAANAYSFISALKQGFETQTGERGVQLSGGQKQRIAIARAIIKNPAILLLDEATSALDAQSERVVQDALDRIMVGRTTIIVAHRLSTIQKCETIAVLQEGVVLEQGSHKQLMSKGEGGAFYSLVQMQNRHND